MSHRSNDFQKPDAVSGFSLLEILLVLLLVSLVTSIVIPQAKSIYNQHQTISDEKKLLAKLQKLSQIAYTHAKPFELYSLPSGEIWVDNQLQLPDNWSVEADEAITFYPNSTCSGGVINFNSGKNEQKIKLLPPYCTIKP